jgi:hypothetical protein
MALLNENSQYWDRLKAVVWGMKTQQLAIAGYKPAITGS